MKFKVGDVVWCIITGRSPILGVVEIIHQNIQYPYVVRFDRDDATHGTVVVQEDEMTSVE